ncbi:MAG: hypothetical protein ACLQFR_16690 [Streptosporangiaceae bacterium]
MAALMTISGPAQAAAAAPKWHRTEVGSPAGAEDGFLLAVSCPTTSQCVGGGYYTSSIGIATPMVATMSGSTWARGRIVVLPATSTDPHGEGQITGVSCPAKNACTAVGFNLGYTGEAYIKEAFTVSQSHGAWGPIHFVTLPPGAAAVTEATLTGVSCTSPGNCEAVGYLAVTGENLVPMAVQEVNGRWRAATEIRIPANAVTAPGAYAVLNAVSCPKPGSCVGVGSYLSATYKLEGLTAVESGGHWKSSAEATLLATAAPNIVSGLLSVSCSSRTSCLAVGGYASTSGSVSASISDAFSNGHWGTVHLVKVVPAKAAARPVSWLFGVSCGTRSCEVVGNYTDSAGTQIWMAVSYSHGKWGKATGVNEPANALKGSEQASIPAGVSCAGTRCTAVGAYWNITDHQDAMAATG